MRCELSRGSQSRIKEPPGSSPRGADRDLGQTQKTGLRRRPAAPRLDLRCHLGRLDEATTKSYILHHLRYAGSGFDIFSDEAVKEIFGYSSGSPRLINKACTHSLIYGHQSQKKIIDDHIVRYIIEKELP